MSDYEPLKDTLIEAGEYYDYSCNEGDVQWAAVLALRSIAASLVVLAWNAISPTAQNRPQTADSTRDDDGQTTVVTGEDDE